MNQTDVIDKLKAIFDKLFDEDINLQPETSAQDIPDWDSLMHVRLILETEKLFKLRFSASEVSSFKNVGDLAKAIAAKAN